MRIATPFPALKLADWQDTNHTVHLMLQVVGKIRLKLHPKANHWWHVPFYVSVNGLTTGPIPYANGLLEMEFNFTDHTLTVKTSVGDALLIPLEQITVAQFYQRVLDALRQCAVEVSINAQPYDMPHIKETDFAACHGYDAYDKTSVETMYQILVSVNNVFQDFRGQFTGKSTPVHLFWHHFDLALTRFSGKAAPPRDGVSQVEREAYSHEVISFGFWFGDDRVPEPAFYAYGFPPPESVYDEPLQPDGAVWNQAGGMAFMPYETVRQDADPRRAILDFLESSYQACARHMDWDTSAFALEP